MAWWRVLTKEQQEGYAKRWREFFNDLLGQLEFWGDVQGQEALRRRGLTYRMLEKKYGIDFTRLQAPLRAHYQECMNALKETQ